MVQPLPGGPASADERRGGNGELDCAAWTAALATRAITHTMSVDWILFMMNDSLVSPMARGTHAQYCADTVTPLNAEAPYKLMYTYPEGGFGIVSTCSLPGPLEEYWALEDVAQVVAL